jgi:protein arginine kinase activator
MTASQVPMDPSPARPILVCVQCGFTLAEFHARGLLGCPSCYDHFGDALFSDMLHLHPLLYRRPPVGHGPHAARDPEDAAALRERLSDALRHERYEEAAALRARLDALSRAADRMPEGPRGTTP